MWWRRARAASRERGGECAGAAQREGEQRGDDDVGGGALIKWTLLPIFVHELFVGHATSKKKFKHGRPSAGHSLDDMLAVPSPVLMRCLCPLNELSTVTLARNNSNKSTSGPRSKSTSMLCSPSALRAPAPTNAVLSASTCCWRVAARTAERARRCTRRGGAPQRERGGQDDAGAGAAQPNQAAERDQERTANDAENVRLCAENEVVRSSQGGQPENAQFHPMLVRHHSSSKGKKRKSFVQPH